jgi:hypothetical protein
VHFNYQGHWNALFCTGERIPQPPQLAGEHLYIFKNSTGYDGQVYHYIAHDPLMRRGFAAYVDTPRFRYRRILVPAAAYLLALGRSDWIDGAYIGVVLASVFIGGWWLSAYFARLGLNAAWGFGFLLIPATLVSIDRMTVDAALMALSAGFVLFLAEDRRWPLYGALAAAPLVRETGLLLIAGYVLSLLWNRKIGKAAIFSTAALPALGWYLFVQIHTSPYQEDWFSLAPWKGIFDRAFTPVHYPLTPIVSGVATLLDYAALTGMGIAILIAAGMAWQRRGSAIDFNVYLFALLATFLDSSDAWTDAYAFTRVLSPLLFFQATSGIANRRLIGVVPLLLAAPRIGLQLAPQLLGILTSWK